MSPSGPFVVGIAGGSGSGKSTLVRAISGTLGAARVSALCYDAYYRDRGDLPAAERAALNYDAPDALDTELFLTDLTALRAGQPARPPRYCFSTHRRIGVDDAVEPRPIVLVEGILLLHDARTRALLDLSIFLDVPDAARLSRRMARDVSERGRTRRSVLSQYEATVRGAHAAWVEPTKPLADLVLLNVGRLDRLAEVAAAVVQQRLAQRAPWVAAA
ncbi:MAG TPA: uridine kinase [Methylomirabilota bacterium]|jgi:uridine kinase|nr:uridine kinase [Methylomirabilota bacterium]